MKTLQFVVSTALVGALVAGCSSVTPSSEDAGIASAGGGPESSGAGSSGGSMSNGGTGSSGGAGSSSSGGAGSSGEAAQIGSPTDAGADTPASPGSDAGNSGGSASGGDGGSVTVIDAGTADGAGGTGAVGAAADAGDASTTRGPGQYTCTLNASTPYHLGAEHRTYTLFGTVIDTTAGANRARVGAIQSFLDTNDLLKWVWPNILTAGHTYEIAMFEDHMRSRTCTGTATAEPQFLLQIPPVTGDFEYKWIAPVPHIASCQDFPSPIP
jgi:hypothetical protein